MAYKSSDRLHAFDVILTLRLIRPAGTLAELAKDLNVVPSQVHSAARPGSNWRGCCAERTETRIEHLRKALEPADAAS